MRRQKTSKQEARSKKEKIRLEEKVKKNSAWFFSKQPSHSLEEMEKGKTIDVKSDFLEGLISKMLEDYRGEAIPLLFPKSIIVVTDAEQKIYVETLNGDNEWPIIEVFNKDKFVCRLLFHNIRLKDKGKIEVGKNDYMRDIKFNEVNNFPKEEILKAIRIVSAVNLYMEQGKDTYINSERKASERDFYIHNPSERQRENPIHFKLKEWEKKGYEYVRNGKVISVPPTTCHRHLDADGCHIIIDS